MTNNVNGAGKDLGIMDHYMHTAENFFNNGKIVTAIWFYIVAFWAWLYQFVPVAAGIFSVLLPAVAIYFQWRSHKMKQRETEIKEEKAARDRELHQLKVDELRGSSSANSLQDHSCEDSQD